MQSPSEHAKAVDMHILASAVQHLLNDDRAAIIHHQHAQIHGGFGGGIGGTAVYRFSGTAQVGDAVREWSLIGKLLLRGDDTPTSTHYWRREAEAYHAGLLNDLDGGLRAPRCFGMTEAHDAVWIWLEEIGDDVGQWPLARYGLTARHLGQFNGAYLTGSPLPDDAWLSQQWIRHNMIGTEQSLRLLTDMPDNPLIAQVLPGDGVARVLRLWDEHQHFLDALDKLPQTLCHHDAFRRNLFAQGDTTVAVDWGFVGIGAVAEDLAAMVWVTLFFMEVSSADIHEFDRISYDSYLTGLRDAGWQGDERLVRLGYTIAVPMRRFVTLWHDLPKFLDAGRHHALEAMMQHPIDDIIAHFVKLDHFTAQLTNEARELYATLF
ncbi:MAG: hypothetical protein D6737_20040 [Chloroflexi bacterium]|nr:MAG: hypothetical protein D6737_20040 [Chloroflexota bacterium]